MSNEAYLKTMNTYPAFSEKKYEEFKKEIGQYGQFSEAELQEMYEAEMITEMDL